ncbi:MAG TPA: DUF349 domain-containing protein [Bacteroidales bacterium]|nr:DUF349 domain-containing protein [Bacteroidales bacterium]
MLDKNDSVLDEQFDSNVGSQPVTAENMDEHAPDTNDEPTSSANEEVVEVSEILPDQSELHDLLHHETDDDEEFNEDPANILESTDLEEEHKELVEDYSILTKEEIIKTLDFLLRNKPVETIRQNVESLKINFYKKTRSEYDNLRKAAEERGEDPESIVIEPDDTEDRLKELLRQYKDLKTAYNEKVEAEKQHNLKEKYKIIDEIKELVNRKESINETFQIFRELQNRWRSIGVVPQANIKDLWETYHHYVEIFYDFIKINKDLRDLDLKRNLEAKIDLCEKSEELLLEPSILKSFKTLQKFHEQWREIGPVPQEMKNDIWERFKAITAKINKRHQEHFESLKDNEKKNLDQKILLCERAEEISSSDIKTTKEWEKCYHEMVELQKVWRAIGFAPKKDNNKVYIRFRTACDSFFARKRDFYLQNKEEQSNNMQLKTDLCIQAESLKDSVEWRSTTEELIQLQKRWKEIGPVSRKYSDAIWKRFRTACDLFFKRKAEHFNSIDTQYDTNLKLKKQLIEEIEAFEPTENTEDNFQKLKDFQRRWTEIGYVPLKLKEEIQNKYREAINKQFENLKLDEGKKNLMRFKSKIENISAKPKSDRKLQLERDKYLNKLKQLENDIVVWENNIGFFAKSKNADQMIAEVQQRIENSKQEIKVLEEKIRMIDNLDE